MIDLDTVDSKADYLHLLKAIAWLLLAIVLGVLALAVG